MTQATEAWFERAAQQTLRAIRGDRSQVAFARRLGYRSNPITDWEHGRRYPTAHETLRACRRVGIDVDGAFARFHPSEPLPKRDDLGLWLDRLRGSMSVSDVALRAGVSRYSVARWFKGAAKPRLPDFLRLTDAITGRVPELVALLVPIANVPELVSRHDAASASKRIAFEAPWTEAILRVLETADYRALPKHRDDFIAAKLAVSSATVAHGLRLLRRAKVVQRRGGLYGARAQLTVEASREPEALHALRAHWGRVIAERAPAAREHEAFGYNVMTVRRADLVEIRRILRNAYREIRARVAHGDEPEVAAFVGLTLFVFDGEHEQDTLAI